MGSATGIAQRWYAFLIYKEAACLSPESFWFRGSRLKRERFVRVWNSSAYSSESFPPMGFARPIWDSLGILSFYRFLPISLHFQLRARVFRCRIINARSGVRPKQIITNRSAEKGIIVSDSNNQRVFLAVCVRVVCLVSCPNLLNDQLPRRFPFVLSSFYRKTWKKYLYHPKERNLSSKFSLRLKLQRRHVSTKAILARKIVPCLFPLRFHQDRDVEIRKCMKHGYFKYLFFTKSLKIYRNLWTYFVENLDKGIFLHFCLH